MMPLSPIRKFLRLEAAGGIVLILASAAAVILANSPLVWFYGAILETHAEIRIGALQIAKPLLLWVNDGLMAVFFLLVGLELKRELLEGELSSPSQAILPAVGALGGIALPAAILLADDM